jgi:hypothetical protein
MAPEVSIILPVYNAEAFLDEAQRATPSELRPAVDLRWIYPLVNIQKTWKITIFNGKIHYFNGNFR